MSSVVVIGSLNMDVVVRTPRFPAPGETLAGHEMHMIPGGKGANQAVAAARLGASVVMVGRVGDDLFAPRLVESLRTDGVDTRFVPAGEGMSTGVAVITVDDHGENSIVIVPGANGRLSPEDVELAAEMLDGADVLVMQLEVPMETVTRAALLAGERNVAVLLNAAPAQALPPILLAAVDHLVVNESEAALLAGGEAEPETLARELRAGGARNVVVTLGAKGSLLAHERGIVRMPGFEVQVVDTTAAGDAFVGAYAVALSEGRQHAAALRRANAAGALAATKLGAQPSLPSRAELEAFLAERGQ